MLLQLLCLGIEDKLPLVLCNQVHFVDEAKYFGLGRRFEDGVEASLVVVQVHVGFTALHVKHVNKNLGNKSKTRSFGNLL